MLSYKYITLLLIVLVNSSMALTLEDIRLHEDSKKLAWADSMDIRIKAYTEIGSIKTEVSIHRITFGKDKEFLETKGSGFHNKVIRDGEQVQTTDVLKKTTVVSKYDGALANMAESISSDSFLSAGEWSEPEVDGELWVLENETGKRLWWDNKEGRFVKMEQIMETGGVLESIIEYCDECEAKNFPKKITSTMKNSSIASTNIIVFEKVAKSSWLKESFFKF